MPWTRPTSGPSRWPRTSAVPATGPSSHWPNGFEAKGEVRSQFHHIIDVAATILDVAGLPEPTFVNGIQQMPLHGVSMAYAFDHADAAEARETQYFEVACNRGIYHKGWTAVTRHSVPWDFGAELPALDDDVWELYDTTTDWSQAHDIAAEHPDKLQGAPATVADRGGEVQRAAPRRPSHRAVQLRHRRPAVLVKGKTQLLYGGMIRLSENSVLNMKNKSHSVTAEVDVPEGGATGVIVAQGGAFAGWSLYLHEGKPKYCHNLAGLMRFYVEGTEPVPAGTHQVRMEFAYDGGGLAKGGTATLFIDGKKVGEGRINATVPMIYSGRRDLRRRPRHRNPGQRGLHQRHQPFHRHRQLGPTRHRRRRPRPPHLPRRAHAGGHRHPVAARSPGA